MVVKEVYVEVPDDAKLATFSGVTNGREWAMHSAVGCYLYMGSKHPLPIEVPLERAELPRPGLYDLDPKSFFVLGDRGRLAIGRNWVLVPRASSSAESVVARDRAARGA